MHAFDGIVWAVKTQPNFRVHLILSTGAIIAGKILEISRWEWVMIVFTIILGLSSELINTSIEAVTDLVTTEYHKDAKIAKDVAAGMMLLTAIGALFVAGLVFIPHLVTR
jgi:diacylglycerol kinase